MIAMVESVNAPNTPEAAMVDQALPGDERNRRTPIGALLVASVGLGLVVMALFTMRWPVDPAAPTVTGAHFSRILTPPAGEPVPAAIARIILNVGIYLILLISVVTVLIGWLRGTSGTARTLALMATLGLLYLAGMALYTSAAVASCGFLLVLFAALSIWITSHSSTNPDEPPVPELPLESPALITSIQPGE